MNPFKHNPTQAARNTTGGKSAPHNPDRQPAAGLWHNCQASHTFLKGTRFGLLALTLASTLALAACGQSGDTTGQNNSSHNAAGQNQSSGSGSNSGSSASAGSKDSSQAASGLNTSQLEVCFGDKGSPFTLHLYDNDTAAAIARHVGTADWRLPIYHYDDYENWEVMQYYDIPSRYEIPSNPEAITSEKAGEVYYSEPNRIVLFYGDAEVSGEYTRVGYFDDTDEFRAAVDDNPVLKDWGNKIVLINSKE